MGSFFPFHIMSYYSHLLQPNWHLFAEFTVFSFEIYTREWTLNSGDKITHFADMTFPYFHWYEATKLNASNEIILAVFPLTSLV